VAHALRYLARLVAVTLAAAALTTVGGGAAAAHPTLLFTEPGSGTAAPHPPETITLLFNEAVTLGSNGVVLLDEDGGDIPVGAATTAREGRFVTASPTAPLAAGTYTARWRVTGADGDLVEGDFRFAVGLAVAGDGQRQEPPPAWGDAAWRWLLFLGLAVAIGGLVGERAAAPVGAADDAAPRPWTGAGSAVALVGVLGLAVSGGAFEGPRLAPAGLALMVASTALAAAVVLALGGRRRWALVPLLASVAAEGVRSHAGAAAPGWGAVLAGVHLAAAAVWVGALVHTLRVVRLGRGDTAATRGALVGYARLATWVFAVVLASGALSALLLAPPLGAWASTGYGRALLVKLALVAGAAGLALAARAALRRRGGAASTRAFARVEAAALVTVLAASAVLASSPPGAPAAQPGPPAAVGPVLPLGTLAGQVGVSLAASDGQVVVRLSTPRRGDYYGPEPDQRYTLSGTVTAGTGTAEAPLAFRGCGQGCFVAPAPWRAGQNVLTLGVEAEGWRGAPVGLLVAWPPTPGAQLLAHVVEATRAESQFTVYEAVTSDTGVPAAPPRRLDLPADFFLAQEPYADGTAPVAALLPRDGGRRRIALGYPAAGMDVLLTLDDAGRIGEETLTDASHLVTRRFVYTEPGGR
jgi:copper transport protein